MNDEFSRLYEAAKALITYIDKEDVFDRAAAGGCSGLDFHQSDTFYDLIVNTRKMTGKVENGLEAEASLTESEKNIRMREGYLMLFEAVKALTAHIDLERAFDKVSDLGPVGFETHQSDEFIKVIQRANEAVEGVKKGLGKESI
ncbi:MAG: hypothetical protein WCA08_25010 [Desulfoferrobacter sp.]